MGARRAMLYMPGDDLHKIQKAATLGVDSVCMDMEDGVALSRKEAARDTIVNAFASVDFGKAERLVRINSLASSRWRQDLEAVIHCRPDAIVLPKITRAEDVARVCGAMGELEVAHGLPEGSTPLVLLIETALAVVDLPRICRVDQRLQGLIFGAEDLAADIGAVRTVPAWEMFYARGAVLLHASAFGLQAIDMVCNDFHNLERLMRESQAGAEMGFSGKQVIHPRQVPVVQEAFTPGDEAVQAASRIVAEFEANQGIGVGAFSIDGKMVDMPVVKTAMRLLERARAAGKL